MDLETSNIIRDRSKFLSSSISQLLISEGAARGMLFGVRFIVTSMRQTCDMDQEEENFLPGGHIVMSAHFFDHLTA